MRKIDDYCGPLDDDLDDEGLDDEEIIGLYCLGCGWMTGETLLSNPYCPRCNGASLDPIYE